MQLFHAWVLPGLQILFVVAPAIEGLARFSWQFLGEFLENPE
jgi:hypothetical protein